MGTFASRDCGDSICGTSDTRDKDVQSGPKCKVKAHRVSMETRNGILLQNVGSRPEDYYSYVGDAKIGDGAFGVVRRATNKLTKHPVAIKAMEISQIKKKVLSFQNEVEIQSSLDHPNIVRLYETFEDQKFVYLAMEICSGGELFDEIINHMETGHNAPGFTEFDVCYLMKQIMRGTHYMHTQGICHRDLKPENFLLKDRGLPIAQNTLKTCDFGIAKRFTQGKPMTTKTGTVQYAAPELLNGKYDEKVDIWSSGVILFILLTGQPPFCGDSDAEIMKEIRRGDVDFSCVEPGSCTQQAKDMVIQLCKKDSAARPSAAEVLKSKWIEIADQPGKSEEYATFKRDFVTKLRAFSSVSRFKKAALITLARHVEDGDIKQLKTAFEKMDADNNGSLNLQEMKNACAEVGLTDSQEVTELFERLDANHEGTISYTEFIAGMMDQKACLKESDLWEAFRIFDADGNGTITLEELQQILKDNAAISKTQRNDVEIEELFKSADKDNSGAISFEEFKIMMTC